MEAKDLLAKPINNTMKTKTFVERYFNLRYLKNNTYVFSHTNRLVLFGISKTHEIFTLNKKIVKFDILFKIGDLDLQNLVSGKKKRGGVYVSPDMKLFSLTCDDSSVYILRSPIKGALIEINPDILAGDFSNLQTDSEASGYIAIFNLPSYEYNVDKACKAYEETTLTN